MGYISHDFSEVYAALADGRSSPRAVTIPVPIAVLPVLGDFESNTARSARSAGATATFQTTGDRVQVRLGGTPEALTPLIREIDRALAAPYRIELEFGVGLTRRGAAVRAVIAAMRDSERLGLDFHVRQGAGVAHTFYRVAIAGPVADVLQVADALGRAAGRPLPARPAAALG